MGQNFSSEPVVEKDTERDHNDTFNVAVSSCQGWRMSQEDNHSLILDLPGGHKAAFFAVYDGHGSARVSKHASEALFKHLTQNEMYKQGNFKEALEQAFLTFDREVNESYNAQLAGTTAICVLIVDNVIYCANIGDSRAVAAVNCECNPLSHDHKPENPQELKRILAAGGYVLGNRVNGNLALSRAFGDFHYKGNEQLPPDQQIVSPCPDIKRIELNDDVDFIVLACDGIWDVLTSEEVVEFVISRLEQNVEPGLICEQLTTRCLATDYELVIGCDNMTVLLVCHTRGRSWEDYCTDIFEKNTKRLGGEPRTRTFQDIDTLNQEVQRSRLRTNPLEIRRANIMDELHDFTSSSTPTGSTLPSLFDTPNTNESSLSGSDGNSSATTTTTATSENNSDYSVLELAANEMRLLLDAIGKNTFNQSASNAEGNDEPSIIEIPVEPDQINTDDNDGDKKSSNTQDNNQGVEDTDNVQTTQESTESNIHELHLSSPDDNELGKEGNTTDVATSDDPTKDPETSSTIATGTQEDTATSNTIEIELPTPDDEQSATIVTEEDISPIENIEEHLKGEADVEDLNGAIEPEESPESGGAEEVTTTTTADDATAD